MNGKKLALTLITLVVGVILLSLTKILTYEVSQTYAYEAVNQVNDSDAAYEAMQTSRGAGKLVTILQMSIGVGLMVLWYRIWRPKNNS